ncbi:MAG TPA: CopD family protein [Gallionellaceae bacterium]|nr:CopD family protein [Gallionellaceae bacterium]
MLWIKSFHIIFVVSWFAGLFYLPRIFVNLAMAKEDAERARLLLMAHKLYRFVTPIGVLALGFGTWLWLGYGFAGMWLNVKLALVVLLAVYHVYCGRLLAQFKQGRNVHGHVWYRWFNEIPVLLLMAVVILVTVKPL